MPIQINNVTRRVVYAASGTGPYNFTFEILAAGDIAVYRDNTLLTITSDYTVTINANGTGYVTLTATPTGATQIAIVGNRTIQRLTDFVTGGDFFANTLNDELDQQTIFAQQNAEGLGRTLQAPQTDPVSINMTLPGRTARANQLLRFDANGDPSVTALSSTGTGNLVLQTSPTLITPTLGVATATSINKVAMTAPATSATLAIADGKTFTVSRSLTLTGTDATTMTFPSTSATIARTDAAQTFTGTQTFSSDASISGVTVGKGLNAVATNTAVGLSALSTNIAGARNTAVGNSALLGNTNGNDNTGVGRNTLSTNTTGGNNTGVGSGVLSANTIGDKNTGIGSQALRDNLSSSNTAVGAEALFVNTTGFSNTGVGTDALKANSTGHSNSAVGVAALTFNQTGIRNTAVGANAGNNINTGSRNTILGEGSVTSAVSSNDQTIIGQGLTGKGDDTAFIGGTNGAYNEKNVTTWETTSDQRIKRDIVDAQGGLAIIDALRVRNYRYLPADQMPLDDDGNPMATGLDPDPVRIGFIAQELEQVLPAAVTVQSNGVRSVSLDPLHYHLIMAVQQLSRRVAELEAKA